MSKRTQIFLTITLFAAALSLGGFSATWTATWNLLFAVFFFASVASIISENAHPSIS